MLLYFLCQTAVLTVKLLNIFIIIRGTRSTLATHLPKMGIPQWASGLWVHYDDPHPRQDLRGEHERRV